MVLTVGMLPKTTVMLLSCVLLLQWQLGGEGCPLDLLFMIKCIVEERSLVFTFPIVHTVPPPYTFYLVAWIPTEL